MLTPRAHRSIRANAKPMADVYGSNKERHADEACDRRLRQGNMRVAAAVQVEAKKRLAEAGCVMVVSSAGSCMDAH